MPIPFVILLGIIIVRSKCDNSFISSSAINGKRDRLIVYKDVLSDSSMSFSLMPWALWQLNTVD